MLTITGLKKSFGGKTAVDIPSLHIHEGETVGLVGNNGAGKTTLFRLCLDLLKADEGTVAILDTDTATGEGWKTVTGAFIDEGFLIDFLTPEEYFEFIGSVSGMTPGETSQGLQHLQRFMAGEVLGQKKLIRDLSAGNKQKAGIAAAMLTRPRLLILDEPFNFLDPTSQNELGRLLTAYNQETGATILVSSHNLQHTVDISSRIVLLEQGRVVQDLDNTGQQAARQLDSYFYG